ncbi:MAG TPA: hypothetical protein VGL20_18100 [Candidatus Dormibacteraeota bacterium]|jgi:hypothetical protein
MSTPGRNDRKRVRIVALSTGAMFSAAMIGGSVMHLSSARADSTTQATTFHKDKKSKDEEGTNVKKSSKTNKNSNNSTSTRKSESNNTNNSSSGSNSSSLVELNNVLNNSLNGLSLHILGL